MDIGRECSYHDAVFRCIFKNLIKHLAYILFRHSKAFSFRIGTVTHQEQYTLFTQFSKTLQVDDLTIDRCVVYFKVACMHYYTNRCMDRQRYCISNRVVCMDEFHHHLTQFHFFTGHHCMSCCGIQHFVFSQLVFQQTQCQQCTKYRHIQLF